jgi:hypothetical protein
MPSKEQLATSEVGLLRLSFAQPESNAGADIHKTIAQIVFLISIFLPKTKLGVIE